MKIGYVVGEFPSLSETFILREILALREAGLDILVFAQQRGRTDKMHGQARPLLAATIYPGRWTEWRWWRKGLGIAVRHPLRLAILLARLIGRYGTHPLHLLKTLRHLPMAMGFAHEAQVSRITHVHAHFAFLPSDLAMMMSALLKLPFSVAVHARDIYTQAPGLLACKVSDAVFVVTCSQYNLDYLAAKLPGINPRLLYLVRHGLDLQDFLPSAGPRDLILGVGRFERKKGFDYLIEACRILHNRGLSFRCILIGEGEQEERLRELVRTHKLEAWVQLMPMLNQEDLRPWFHRAALFVQPSVLAPDGDRDVLPNVLLEAMALQIPVVATRVAAIPEAVVDGETGLLAHPGDEADLADKVARLLQDTALGAMLAEQARRKIASEYDVRRNVEPLIALFKTTQ